MQGRSARVCLIAAIAGIAIFVLPISSANALLLEQTRNCEPGAVTKPFAPWGDTADYVLAPDGAVESSTSAWTLRGASIANYNSPFYSNSPGDSHSVAISKGGSATTATMCIGKEHPTIRFFAKNQSTGISFLDVQVEVETAFGREVSLPVGIERGNQVWEPSSSMRLIVNYLNLAPNTYTPVEFKFTARNGDWLIDDVYVDPRRN
jgi:hypothetical protein